MFYVWSYHSCSAVFREKKENLIRMVAVVAIKKHEKHTVVWISFGFNLGGDPQVKRSRRPRIREGRRDGGDGEALQYSIILRS
jgi:hypothetical protein